MSALEAAGPGHNSRADAEAREDLLATDLANRMALITGPYLDREGPAGFRSIISAEADELAAMPFSRRELLEGVASYRRRLEDTEAIAMAALEALAFLDEKRGARNTPKSGAPVGVRGGRPRFESERAMAQLGEMYPGGVPANLRPADLYKAVANACAAKKLIPPSLRTVNRAREKLADG